MAEEDKKTEDKPVELTQEQKDQASAEKYRSQFADADPAAPPQKTEDASADDKPQRPDHIPEKFWDAEKGEVRLEDLAKSYAELEKARAKPADEKPEGKSEDGKGDEGGEGDDPFVSYAKDLSSHREKMTEKITKGEELTDDDFKPFEKVGLSKDDILDFIAGQEARGMLQAQALYAEAGGEDQYKAMIEWGRSTFSPEEVAAYDKEIHSVDEAVRMTAVRGLAARYAMAQGSSGKDVTQGGASKSANGYSSGAEMRADMKDPRYAKDPAFRAEVARKTQAAMSAGIDLRMP